MSSTSRARVGVSVLFATNGWLFANLVPRYPDLKAGLGLANDAFGSAVAAYGVGALVSGLLAAALIGRFGSARTAYVATVAASANLLLIALAPSWLTFAAALLLTGAVDSICDLAQNAQGLLVERIHNRSILNSMHALWSIGAVLGGLTGSVAAGLDLPVLAHFAVAAAVSATIALVAGRLLLPDSARGSAKSAESPEHPVARRRARAWTSKLAFLLALGTIAAMAQTIEEVTATWSAVYLRGDLGATAWVGGLGFVALQTLQVVGRLIGDPLVTRFGDRRVAVVGTLLAAVSMTLALIDPSPVAIVLGFGMAGLGIGTLIPAGLRAADGVPGLPAGLGISAVGTVLRVSVVLSPLLAGVLAQRYGVRAAIMLAPSAAFLALALSRLLPGPQR